MCCSSSILSLLERTRASRAARRWSVDMMSFWVEDGVGEEGICKSGFGVVWRHHVSGKYEQLLPLTVRKRTDVEQLRQFRYVSALIRT